MVLYLWRYIVPEPQFYNTGHDPYMQCDTALDDFVSLIWRERYQEPGEFQLTIPATAEMLRYFTENTVMITKSGTDTAMFADRVVLKTSSDSGDYLTISGKSAEGLLQRRIVMDRDTVSGTAVDVVNKLIDRNIGAVGYSTASGADARRYINLLRHGNNAEITSSVSIEPFGQNLGSLVSETCKAVGCGFRVRHERGILYHELYTGERRQVEFSPRFANIGDTEYTYDTSGYTTHVIVGGSGTGTGRAYGDAYNQNWRRYDGCGINARETYENASGTTDSGLYAAAQLSMLSKSVTQDCNVDVLPDGAFRYRRDYWLGDTVSVRNPYGITGVKTVSEVTETVDSAGRRVIPTLV